MGFYLTIEKSDIVSYVCGYTRTYVTHMKKGLCEEEQV